MLLSRKIFCGNGVHDLITLPFAWLKSATWEFKWVFVAPVEWQILYREFHLLFTFSILHSSSLLLEAMIIPCLQSLFSSLGSLSSFLSGRSHSIAFLWSISTVLLKTLCIFQWRDFQSCVQKTRYDCTVAWCSVLWLLFPSYQMLPDRQSSP